MAKRKTKYVCRECGAASIRRSGKCPACKSEKFSATRDELNALQSKIDALNGG